VGSSVCFLGALSGRFFKKEFDYGKSKNYYTF
jgi:hypothetical protein